MKDYKHLKLQEPEPVVGWLYYLLTVVVICIMCIDSRYTVGGDGKVSIDWSIAFKTEDGRTIKATIYAWKTEGYVPPVDELFKWNVGGHNLDALDCVYQAIEKAKGL